MSRSTPAEWLTTWSASRGTMVITTHHRDGARGCDGGSISVRLTSRLSGRGRADGRGGAEPGERITHRHDCRHGTTVALHITGWRARPRWYGSSLTGCACSRVEPEVA